MKGGDNMRNTFYRIELIKENKKDQFCWAGYFNDLQLAIDQAKEELKERIHFEGEESKHKVDIYQCVMNSINHSTEMMTIRVDKSTIVNGKIYATYNVILH